MKFKFISIFLLLSFILFTKTQAQDTIFNQTDANGLKQGYWKKKYPEGGIQYTGHFKNNKPVGEFTRYTREGTLYAKMKYAENSDKIYTTFFYPNKQVQAEGYYINKLKDSTWSFYSEKGILVSTINFFIDKKHGSEIRYYDNGNIFEKILWENGLQNGISIRYYNNGNVMIRSPYINGLLSGSYASYSENGKPIISGMYENNRRQGKWIIYDELGNVKNEIVYINGVAENQEELDKIEQEELDMLEKNKGKFQDPLEMMYNNIPPM
ncbi:MAG: hypothetical protein A2W99_03230 [Bacteroidetes bacterium GWF2_33_16]|nr:MAG: hypothetical protein A2X00_09785 [Bacteroidetes bacterium GWE2_32_14]OFY07906.1 MAG: hypothetical protein A2W99_03230 [Bacteroidetes bacterium GWF2_33_16]